MKFQTVFFLFFLWVLLTFSTFAEQSDKPYDQIMRRPFQWLKTALETNNETLFRTHWHPDGYTKNPSGGPLTGKSLFHDWKEKGWFLQPRFNDIQRDGENGSIIVPCEIISNRENTVNGSLWALPVYKADKGIWVILAVNENYRAIVNLSRELHNQRP